MRKLILMAVLLIASGVSMAQKVVNVDGKAVIDNRAMPAGATITEKVRTTDATATTLGTNNLTNLASAESNKTVSRYFEVAKTDSNNGIAMNWLTAIQSCTNYDSGDGVKTWRSPTQREAMLIRVFSESLMKIEGFEGFNTSWRYTYWCATESNEIEGYYVGLYRHHVNHFTKVNPNMMRCIRDLTPTN